MPNPEALPTLIPRAQVPARFPMFRNSASLAHLAHNGKGPPYILVGGKAWYEVADIMSWIDSNKRHPTNHLTYLVTEYGRPFTAAGFGNWFRDRCDEAGLTECTAHGLRKAGATRAANNGASAHQLKAVFGWAGLMEAERYTRAADQERLAGSGILYLAEERKERK